jgi:hypothetical protein
VSSFLAPLSFSLLVGLCSCRRRLDVGVLSRSRKGWERSSGRKYGEMGEVVLSSL